MAVLRIRPGGPNGRSVPYPNSDPVSAGAYLQESGVIFRCVSFADSGAENSVQTFRSDSWARNAFG